MNEEQFLQRWESEKPQYEAWVQFIKHNICEALKEKGIDLNVFFKVPVSYRLKENESLIDKVFHRKKDIRTYESIEDKVGMRFITLLLENVNEICEIIDNSELWTKDNSRDFNKERDKNPLIFDYQSMHYILRPSKKLQYNNIEIPIDTPCEIQVRTLLQHAYAELTHDAIYKVKNQESINPKIHRKVARSMALIETTDEFFESVNKELKTTKLEEFDIKNRLDSLYLSLVGNIPVFEKSSIIIWNSYDNFITEDLIYKVQKFYQRKPFYIELIKDKSKEKSIYRQSIIFFLILLVDKYPSEIADEWPISREIIEEIALDCGQSYFRD